MKKVFLVCLLMLSVLGCAKQEVPEDKLVITNPITMNGEKADMSSYQWVNDPDNAFIEISMAESTRFFTEKGSGIVVYGYPGCMFCERALPELNKIAKENDIKVHYVNVYRQDMTPEIYERLRPYLEPIFETENGQPVFKVPEVVAIKNGEIVGHHLALVKGYHIDSETSQMNDEQKQELQNIYLELFKAAAD